MSKSWTTVSLAGKRLPVGRETGQTLERMGLQSRTRDAWTFTDSSHKNGQLIVSTDDALVVILGDKHLTFPREDVQSVTDTGLIVAGEDHTLGTLSPVTVTALERDLRKGPHGGETAESGSVSRAAVPDGAALMSELRAQTAVLKTISFRLAVLIFLLFGVPLIVGLLVILNSPS